MEINNILVTGDYEFIYRHRYLWDVFLPHFNNLDILTRKDSLNLKINAVYQKIKDVIAYGQLSQGFHKTSFAFKLKSQEVERTISNLNKKPDLIFHLYGMWSPFWNNPEIPYTILTDYTMSLAIQNWSEWSPFKDEQEKYTWLEYERKSYQRAYHIFPKTHLAKSSLVRDYGVNPEKITVIGSAGNFKDFYSGEKIFGSKQILFNGSEFYRKGGDIVLTAFKKVRQVIPEAKLVIVGKTLENIEDGVENLGKVSNLQIRDLLLQTDLLVAPARCEPLGLILIEAMNYGVPCIVSRNGGISEVVNHERNGFIIDNLNPDILAEKIIQLLSNSTLLKSMSIQARKTVQDKFNWNRIGEKIIHSLRSQSNLV